MILLIGMNYFGNYPKPWFWFLLVPVFIWDLVIRGIALWKSASHGQKVWFVFLLIVNSLGILPIIYLLFFQKKGTK